MVIKINSNYNNNIITNEDDIIQNTRLFSISICTKYDYIILTINNFDCPLHAVSIDQLCGL